MTHALTGDPGMPEPAHVTTDEALGKPSDGGEAADADSFADKDPVHDPAQDRDDADPSAIGKPVFDDGPVRQPGHDHDVERHRTERGNRGPEEEPGFGQGA